jgi:rhodanese-related sulfurtransferase
LPIYAYLNAAELKEKLNSGDTTFVVLDVRTPEELTGEMPKIESAIAIPLQELNERASELDKYKDKEIYVICRSGRRSAAAVNTLKPKGYNVINVSGGMLNYTREK